MEYYHNKVIVSATKCFKKIIGDTTRERNSYCLHNGNASVKQAGISSKQTVH